MGTPQSADALLGWIDIAKIVLASGVVAAVIGWLKDGLFKHLERRRNAKYSAIGVIAKLDLYVLQSRVNVRDYFDSIGPLIPERDYQDWPSCPYPELQISDDELKSLEPEHASSLAWLSTEKALANQHLYAVNDAAHDPITVYFHEAHMVGYFGYEAYLLANRLREKYSLPSLNTRWQAGDEFYDLQGSWVHTRAERYRIAQLNKADDE